MGRLFISDIRGGLDKVLPPHLINPNRVSEANNVVYRRGKWKRRPGYTKPFGAMPDGLPIVEIFDYLQPDNTLYTLACTTQHIYSLNGTNWIQQKELPVARAFAEKWFSTEIRDNLFVTNGVDKVQHASIIDNTLGNSFNDVVWDTTADADANVGRDIMSAKIVLAFNSRLLLFNISDTTDGSVPTRMAWSEVLDFDRVEIDNFNDLDFNNSPIIHARKLGNGMIAVYKEDAVSLVQDTGSPLFFVPRFTQNVGLIAPKAVTDIPQGNFFVSQEGFFFFIAGGVQPVGDDTVVSYFFDTLYEGGKDNIYCYTDKRNREVIIMYPANPSFTHPTKALIYNWQYDIWYEWDLVTSTAFYQFRQTTPPRVLFGTTGGNVLLSGGTTDDGATITSKIHTRAFINEPSRENPQPSDYVQAIKVKTDATPSTTTVKVGQADTGAATPTFTTSQLTVTSGRAPFADMIPVWGRYMTIGAEGFDELTEFQVEWFESGD